MKNMVDHVGVKSPRSFSLDLRLRSLVDDGLDNRSRICHVCDICAAISCQV